MHHNDEDDERNMTNQVLLYRGEWISRVKQKNYKCNGHN
jgi:hypothetical protein